MSDSADGLLDQWLQHRGTPTATPTVVPPPTAEADHLDESAPASAQAELDESDESDEQAVEVEFDAPDLLAADPAVSEVREVLDLSDQSEDVAVEIEPVPEETSEAEPDAGAEISSSVVEEVDAGDDSAEPSDTVGDGEEEALPYSLVQLSTIEDELARMATEPTVTRVTGSDPASAVLAAFAALDAPLPAGPAAMAEPEPENGVGVEPDTHHESDPEEEMVEEGGPVYPEHEPATTPEPETPPQPEPEPLPEPEPAPEPEPLPEPERLEPPDPAIDPTAVLATLPPLSASTAAILASLTAPAAAPVASAAADSLPPSPEPDQGEPSADDHTSEHPEEQTEENAEPEDRVERVIAATAPTYGDHRSPAEIADSTGTEPAAHPDLLNAERQPVTDGTAHYFAPRRASRLLLSTGLGLGLIATVAACWWAFSAQTVASIVVAAVIGVVTALIWAARAGTSTTHLSMIGSRLVIERAGTRTQFDLADPHTPVAVHGVPEDHDWTVTFSRRGMASVVLDPTVVDPREFMDVFDTHRPQP